MSETSEVKRYLKETVLLDYFSPSIQTLINERGWQYHDDFNKINSRDMLNRDYSR